MIEKLKNIFSKYRISNPPWNYYFLLNLEEREYPGYLAKLFKINTGENLPLKYDFKNRVWVIDKKRCKTFNQKLQWIKLYGVTDLMIKCTDKVVVRDYVREKIGEEYLKPVLQIIPAQSIEDMHNSPPLEGCLEETGWSYQNYFDQINWDKFPNAFVIKCNHGSKWQYIIKDKEEFLNNPQLFETVKRQMTGWLEQEFFPWNGFEMQYMGIEPKILIEPLMRDDLNSPAKEINMYFYNNSLKLAVKIHNEKEVTIWDENLNYINYILSNEYNNIYEKANNIIKQTYDLSNQLIENLKFEFIRVDWMIYQNRPYFEEFTFTPYSGFNNELKNLINLERI